MREWPEGNETRRRILIAVLAVATERGLSRLAVEEVAARAGLSRQTVYRYFPTKGALVEAAILREEGILIEAMVAAAEGIEDLHEALAAAILTGLRAAREHPLLDRLVEQDAESLLPFLLLGRGPVISAAEPVVERLLLERLPGADPARLRLVADAATRLIVSYVVSPSDAPQALVAEHLARLIADTMTVEK